MNRNSFTVGTPLLLALILVSAVSLSARLYRDRGLSQKAEANTTQVKMVIVQGE